jgi:ketosteroid isomerase-like protein
MDALQFVCRGDIDRALALAPDDYQTTEYDYDDKTNTTGRSGSKGKLSKLLFVKINA